MDRIARFCQPHTPPRPYLDSVAYWATQEVALRLWVRNCVVVSIWS